MVAIGESGSLGSLALIELSWLIRDKYLREFDGQAFVSGIQLMASSYSNVMQTGGNGQVQGIGSVNTVSPSNRGPIPIFRISCL